MHHPYHMGENYKEKSVPRVGDFSEMESDSEERPC